ncbi:MAG: RNA polymerase sigma factor [Caldilinea sp. CFX5]|nr:RNA polymerase sigma factor [Caldilinea sp. CFX5]
MLQQSEPIMTTATVIDQWRLQERLLNARPRLQGLCAYLTGDPDSAEDLVQEVLLEAWRSFTTLRNPDAVDAWLNGIVRNVCARWRRTRRREATWLRPDQELPGEGDPNALVEHVAEPFDLELLLDRQELAELLDRALALLPATTRDVLVRKYIAEARHAEIADQLGMNENAVTVCLHRGKVAPRSRLDLSPCRQRPRDHRDRPAPDCRLLHRHHRADRRRQDHPLAHPAGVVAQTSGRNPLEWRTGRRAGQLFHTPAERLYTANAVPL